MIQQDNLQYVRIGLASPEQIRNWAERCLPNGELTGLVSKPYTIHYQTHKPEKDGLFCERIFGPVKSGVCACGKYQGIPNIETPKYCEQCGVELIDSKVRRHRMGYIRLACPVTHVWYLQAKPSLISILLNQPLEDIESLVYYDTFLARPITNHPRLLRLFSNQSGVYKKRGVISLFNNSLQLFAFDANWQKSLDRFFSFRWFNLIQSREMLTGGYAIYQLLKDLDLPNSITEAHNRWLNLVHKSSENQILFFDSIQKLSIDASLVQGLGIDVSIDEKNDEIIQQQKNTLLRRMVLIKHLLKAKIQPEWTVLFNLPVLPPDLRPIVQLKDGQLIRSDLNELYRMILQRNHVISQLSTGGPICVSMMQKRLLQEAVDALLANGVGNTIRDRNMKPYKSISDIIKGKKGRFRENLLGKRVDYSGRSVIVVGPTLSLHQCGLPREMAIDLFQPFVVRSLISQDLARNPRDAKRIIQQKNPIIWRILKTVIYDHVVVLNRAPTLHRLGVQAFQPLLVRERAIHLHPLVCSGFNADFDGDQMAVHVPLSLEAQAEAHILMSPYFNLLSPATGDAVTLPSQDMLLGLYSLTLGTQIGMYLHKFNQTNLLKQKNATSFTFKRASDILTDYQEKRIVPESSIWLYWLSDMKVINNSVLITPIETQYESQGTQFSIYQHWQIRSNRLGMLYSQYMRTTAGRIIFNQQIEQAIQSNKLI